MKNLVKVRVHAVNEIKDSRGNGYPQAVSCVFELDPQSVFIESVGLVSQRTPQDLMVHNKIKEFESLGGEGVKMLVELVKKDEIPSWEK